MPKKSSNRKTKKKDKKLDELTEKVDYSYITEDEIKSGFKPSNVIQAEAVVCPFCSTTNTYKDEFCFNCRKKLEQKRTED